MKKKLSDLIDIDRIEKLLRAFTESTNGVVTAILDLEGNVLISTGWHDICVKFHRLCPATAARCRESDTILAGRLKAGCSYNVYQCLNGLVDVAVPIIVMGEHVGNLFTGQFLFNPPEIEFFRRQAKEFGFDEQEYLLALAKVPVVTEEEIRKHMDFLTNLVGFIGELGQMNEQLATEIDERKHLEEDRIKLERQLQQSQKMQALGTLAGGVAHDFNNLLTPILGYAQLTKMGLDPACDEVQYQDNILESANRAKDLVKKILLISQSPLGEPEPVQLKNLLQEVLSVVAASKPQRISIHHELEFNLPPICADPSLIYQVILNLCTNAIHAMSGEGELWLRLHRVSLPGTGDKAHDPMAEFVCLSIEDSGCGMDAEILERIYEPFFSTKEKGETRGTGLGLAIVSNVVEQYRGQIEVESSPGEGSIFRVYFPVADSREKPCTEQKKSGKGANDAHILLLDDEKMVNEMGTTILTRLGYRVSSFIDGQEALTAFAADPKAFQLIITDYSMPNLTGPEFLEKIKNIRQDIPMIMVTGYCNLITSENLQNWGCSEIIAKPYNIMKLQQTLDRILAKPVTGS